MTMARKPSYCTQPGVERCEECSLNNYHKDCRNNPIGRPYGARRSAEVAAKLFLIAPAAPGPGVSGYWEDLARYQGEESYYKLGRLLETGNITQEQHDRIEAVLRRDDAVSGLDPDDRRRLRERELQEEHGLSVQESVVVAAVEAGERVTDIARRLGISQPAASKAREKGYAKMRQGDK